MSDEVMKAGQGGGDIRAAVSAAVAEIRELAKAAPSVSFDVKPGADSTEVLKALRSWLVEHSEARAAFQEKVLAVARGHAKSIRSIGAEVTAPAKHPSAVEAAKMLGADLKGK